MSSEKQYLEWIESLRADAMNQMESMNWLYTADANCRPWNDAFCSHHNSLKMDTSKMNHTDNEHNTKHNDTYFKQPKQSTSWQQIFDQITMKFLSQNSNSNNANNHNHTNNKIDNDVHTQHNKNIEPNAKFDQNSSNLCFDTTWLT